MCAHATAYLAPELVGPRTVCVLLSRLLLLRAQVRGRLLLLLRLRDERLLLRRRRLRGEWLLLLRRRRLRRLLLRRRLLLLPRPAAVRLHRDSRIQSAISSK